MGLPQRSRYIGACILGLFPRPYPRTMDDDTLVSWFAVLSTFASWFSWIGLVKGMAVLLPTLQDQFDTSTWFAGWMVAIIDGVIDLTGPIAPLLAEKVGVRFVVMLSGVLITTSLVVASFVSSFPLLTLVIAGVAAPAVGACNIVSRGLIGRCFPKSHAKAFAIGASGGGVAFITSAPLTQFLVGVYGWRGTLMLLGALMSHVVVCGAFIRKEPRRQRINNNNNYTILTDEEASESCTRDCNCSLLAHFISCLNLKLFAIPGYWLITSIAVCTSAAATSWVVYFVPHTYHSKGFSLYDIGEFVAVFGVGKLSGNIVASFPDCLNCPSKALLAVGIIGSSVSFLIDPLLTSYWSIMAYALTYGCCHSIIYTLLDVVTKEEIGGDLLGSALGWITLKAGIVRSLILFFPGLIYDNNGDYALAFVLLSAINAIALLPLLILKLIEFRKKNKKGEWK